MSKAVLNASRITVKRWLKVQLIVIGMVTFLSLLLVDVEFAQAIFVGGMVCFIPSILFAKSWFSFFSARYPQQMLVMFYFGEVIKFFLMSVLFLFAFKFLAVAPLPVVLGFVSAQIGFFLGPILKT